MRTYILRRLAISAPILLGLTMVTFIFTELMPGDFVDALIPPLAIVNYTPEQLESMRENYGLNKPPHIRYLIWLRELGKGNMGKSLISGAPVRDEILQRMPATLQLTATSRLGELRRDIAQIMTVQRERELVGSVAMDEDE